jgi:thioredoxin 1
MAQKYAGRAKVVKVNVDDNPRIAQQFQIMSIPTLMVFKNGSAIKRQVGANPAIIPSMIEGRAALDIPSPMTA